MRVTGRERRANVRLGYIVPQSTTNKMLKSEDCIYIPIVMSVLKKTGRNSCAALGVKPAIACTQYRD